MPGRNVECAWSSVEAWSVAATVNSPPTARRLLICASTERAATVVTRNTTTARRWNLTPPSESKRCSTANGRGGNVEPRTENLERLSRDPLPQQRVDDAIPVA